MNGQAAGVAQNGSITVTRRTERSALTFIVQHLLKAFNSKIVKMPDPVPAGSPKQEPAKKVLKLCEVKERKVDDLYVYDLIPRKPASEPAQSSSGKVKKRIYYFAGGGWVMPATGEHWKVVGDLACRLSNTTVTLVSYPLGPHSGAPVAFPQLMHFYHKVLKEAEDQQEEVVFAGDSAGGNIILCLVLHALSEDPDAQVPKALLAMAPSCDLTRQNPDIQKLAKHDPLLRYDFICDTAHAWCGAWDHRDSRVSPLFADVGSLARRGVRVNGMTSGYDILSLDATLFREKCSEAGVQGEWLHWERQIHCFFLAFSFKLKESNQALDWMVDVLQRA